MPKAQRNKKRLGFVARLRRHLKADPANLPVLEQTFARYERPNLHLALQELIKELPDPPELSGVLTQQDYDQPRLARLSRKATAKRFADGPVEYRDVCRSGRRTVGVRQTRTLFLE
jgi:hypothetical protein